MKKFLFLLLTILALICFVSCEEAAHEKLFNDEKLEIFSIDYSTTTDGKIKATVNASEKANSYWYRVGSDNLDWIPTEEEHSQSFTEEEIIAGLHFRVTYTRKSIKQETVLSAIYDADGWLIRITDTEKLKDREYLLNSKANGYYYCHFVDSKCGEAKKGTLTAESFKTSDEKTVIEFSKDENGTQKFESLEQLVKAFNEKEAYVKQQDSSYKPVERNIGSSDIQSCTVSFIATAEQEEATNWPINQQVKIDDKAIKPSDPVMTGLVFVDWYTTPDYTSVWNFDNSVTTNTNLYAKFAVPEDVIIFTATEGTVTLGMSAVGTAPEIELEYVSDGNWKDFVVGTTSITLTAGTKNNKAYFRAKTTNTSFASANGYNCYTTEGTGKLSVSGDVMWLLDKETTETDMDSYSFAYLFRNCSNIEDASSLELSCTTLTERCYSHMFSFCTGLENAPTLPATQLTTNCYENMFEGCTALKSLAVKFTDWNTSEESTKNWLNNAGSEDTVFTCPKELKTPQTSGADTLPANWKIDKEMYTVRYMMNDETQVVFTSQTNVDWDATIKAPEEDPVRAGFVFVAWYKEASCINLWDFDTDKVTANTDLYALYVPLKDALIFTATEGTVTLGMSAVGTAPEIELEYVASGNWKDFVVGTTSITLTAGTRNDKAFFRAKTTNTSISSANGYNCYTTEGTGKLSVSGDVMWLLDKETTETDMDSCSFAYLFRNCSNIEDASSLELSCTTLTERCYSRMFSFCTGLENAPTLPATQLTTNCYENMFEGCSSLKSLTVSFTDWNSSEESTKNWLNNAGSEDTVFTCPKELKTPQTRGADTLPANWKIDKEMYTVRYMMNDGTQVMFTSQTNIDWDSTIKAPEEDPVRTGYGFDSWYKEASCTNKWNFETDKITTNTNLYAKWSQNQGFGYEILSDTDLTCEITKTKTQGMKEWTLTATSSTDFTYSWYVNAVKQPETTNVFVFKPASGSYLIECVITKGTQRGSEVVRINSWDEE